MKDVAVRLTNVGKMYKIFASRRGAFVDAIGLAHVMPWLRVPWREFWALREIDLELRRGSRMGIIGRNGAGKSTLLKLITGNLDPTVGRVEVGGDVQALIDAGAGFHPEFTGRENIHASLTYQGLTGDQIDEATSDIVDFAELEEFLDQPLKTYSLGMQARLAFATATVIRPEIVIIDEILGAGDAYFLSKCKERIVQLVGGGASLLLVSHSLDHITLLCDEALWIDRGRIVMRGASLEVVKAYERHIRVLEDRRLKAKNRETWHSREVLSVAQEPRERVLVRFVVSGPGAFCEVGELKLWAGTELEDAVHVGNAQDADPAHSACVVVDGGDWSGPRDAAEGLFRALVTHDASPSVSGAVAFTLYPPAEGAAYALEVRYRSSAEARLELEMWRDGTLHSRADLPACDTWVSHRTALGQAAPAERPASATKEGRVSKSRWPGERSVVIDRVQLLGAHGAEQAVFEVGEPMTLRVTMVAQVAGGFEVIPVAVLYRTDGIRLSSHVGRRMPITLASGERRSLHLRYESVNLGNGRFVFSVALYRVLDALAPEIYDLLDRSYEFQVVGTPPLEDGLFRHPGEWRLE